MYSDYINKDSSNNESLLFVPRMFAQHPFPKSNLPDPYYWTKNGGRVLIMASGLDYSPSEEKVIPVGLPFGIIPRLLIGKIASKVVRSCNQEIKLADDISDLLDKINYEVSGGKTGSITQLHSQVKRLLNCRITYKYSKDIGEFKRGNFNLEMGPFDGSSFWEASYGESNDRLYDIRIKLHDHFYHEVKEHSFPVKEENVHYLRPSTMAIDLYLFLTHRMYSVSKDTYISWKSLNRQFGSNYSNHLDFGRRARKYLRKIRSEIYPEVNFSFEPGRLVLKKSKTPVSKLSTNKR